VPSTSRIARAPSPGSPVEDHGNHFVLVVSILVVSVAAVVVLARLIIIVVPVVGGAGLLIGRGGLPGTIGGGGLAVRTFGWRLAGLGCPWRLLLLIPGGRPAGLDRGSRLASRGSGLSDADLARRSGHHVSGRLTHLQGLR